MAAPSSRWATLPGVPVPAGSVTTSEIGTVAGKFIFLSHIGCGKIDGKKLPLDEPTNDKWVNVSLVEKVGHFGDTLSPGGEGPSESWSQTWGQAAATTTRCAHLHAPAPATSSEVLVREPAAAAEQVVASLAGEWGQPVTPAPSRRADTPGTQDPPPRVACR